MPAGMCKPIVPPTGQIRLARPGIMCGRLRCQRVPDLSELDLPFLRLRIPAQASFFVAPRSHRQAIAQVVGVVVAAGIRCLQREAAPAFHSQLSIIRSL